MKSKSRTSTSLRAGAALVDITPAKGIQISGDIGRRRPVEEIREQIHARALVLEQGRKRACIVSLDLALIISPWGQEVRRRAAQQFGLDPQSIMLHTTQNHSAPSLGNDTISEHYQAIPPELAWLCGGDPRYYEPTVARILEAIGQAIAALQPVTVQAGRGMDGRVAFNRRFIMRDGTGKTHPDQCSPEILYCEGPMDPEVGVLTFRAKSGKAVAALLHHTCHPVHGFPHNYVIADWPGVWAAEVEKQLGAGSVALVLNGLCGNIHHRNHLDPHYKNDHRRVGRLLAETTATILKQMTEIKSPRLDYRQTFLRLPYRKIPAKDQAAAHRLIAQHPKPIWLDKARTRVSWDWMYATSVLDVVAQQKHAPYYQYEIQAFRIGDVLLLGCDGEPFVEAQLEIKLHSPAKQTMVAHLCNNYVGYVPTRGAFKYGGYETHTANWSKLDPGALGKITKGSLTLLRKIW